MIIMYTYKKTLIQENTKVRPMTTATENMFTAKITKETDKFTHISVLASASVLPCHISVLNKQLALLDWDSNKGVCIYCNGARWIETYLSHYFKTAKFVAHLDAQSTNCVIVHSNDVSYPVGFILLVKDVDFTIR